MAISITGLGIVLDTAWELPGVAMIIGGVLVAVHGMSAGGADRVGVASAVPNSGSGHDSMVGWPSGLGARLARRSPAPPKGGLAEARPEIGPGSGGPSLQQAHAHQGLVAEIGREVVEARGHAPILPMTQQDCVFQRASHEGRQGERFRQT
jgi:hypothetical protein